MAIKSKEKKIGSDQTKWRLILVSFIEFCLGFLFASVTVGESFAPFGPAFASVCNFPGLLGVLLGCMVCGRNVLRGLVASAAAYFGIRLILPVTDKRRETVSFAVTLWAFLFAALIGTFFASYTFKENAFFSLGGVVGGFFAYVLSLTADNLRQGAVPPSRIRFAAFAVVSAALFAALAGVGGSWRYTAYALIAFTLCGLTKRGSFFYVCTYAMALSFGLCLYEPGQVWAAGIITLGTVLGSLLLPLGRMAVPCGFLLSSVVTAVWAGDGFSFWPMLLCVGFGSTVCAVIPEEITDKVFRFLLPSRHGATLLRRRITVSEKGKERLLSSERFDAVREICADCPERLLCWVKHYDTVSRLFEDLESGKVGEHDAKKRFCSFCSDPEGILRVFRRVRTERNGCRYALDFARVSMSKGGETVCGDTTGTFATEDGQYILCIADGMGTGHGAARQSEKAEKIMESLLKSGVDRGDAVSFINSAVAEDGQESILGLDLAVINLFDGACDMYKADAAPTYIVRRGTVYLVGSASLPLGASECADVRRHFCRLADGDFLVMVSDGLCGDGQKRVAQGMTDLCRNAEPTCLSLADGILNAAADGKTAGEDDMTVIVAKITRAGT